LWRHLWSSIHYLRAYCLKIVIIACFHVLFSPSIKVLSVHHCLSKHQTYSICYTPTYQFCWYSFMKS
jgi:hypothetical protein